MELKNQNQKVEIRFTNGDVQVIEHVLNYHVSPDYKMMTINCTDGGANIFLDHVLMTKSTISIDTE